MKQIKVSEATNTQLDWLVAKCEGKVEQGVYGEPAVVGGNLYLHYCDTLLSSPYNPTTDWSQMGPIIEREKITVIEGMDDEWQAATRPFKFRYGPTMLIAAARCYVASKMGAIVEVPDEL